MYKASEKQLKLELFPMYLIPKNSEWIKMRDLIPWALAEAILGDVFSSSDKGRPAIPVRHILGALIIQAKMNLTDRDTLMLIANMPALQYFLGFADFSPVEIFDFTLLCKYRQLIGIDMCAELIDEILNHNGVNLKPKVNKTHEGSLSIDATVIPVNITYPTDLKLLNEARLKSEQLIDELYETSSLVTKPRTYRKEAKIAYLKYAKAKRLSKSKRFSGMREQLQYLKRNLNTINKYADEAIFILDEQQKSQLALIHKIYDQQYYMRTNKVNRVEDRIVNFHQPHIRGIVRGKAGTNIEFGPKVCLSKVNGYVKLDKISFINFNESTTFKKVIDDYFIKYGVYPEVIRADKIYQTKDNRNYAQSLGIRFTGKKLGKKATNDDHVLTQLDNQKRQEIEGIFGVIKTKYGLANLMTKLPASQIASIGIVLLVLNLMHIMRKVSFLSKIEVVYLMIGENETIYIYEDE